MCVPSTVVGMLACMAVPTCPNQRSAAVKKSDKEQPLIDDIRLLGRMLGDVIREQEGSAAFELIEQVRKLSVAFRRDADAEADKALKKLLKSLSTDETVRVIRAFRPAQSVTNRCTRPVSVRMLTKMSFEPFWWARSRSWWTS